MKTLAILLFHLLALPAEQTVPVSAADLINSFRQAGFALKLTSVAPSITLNDVTEQYKKQEDLLFQGWLRSKEGRPEIAKMRADLQHSYETLETAWPSLKGIKFYGYADEARQISVGYLEQEGQVLAVVARIPSVDFKQSKEGVSLETVIRSTADAFETMTKAPFTTSMEDAVTLIEQMEKDQDPRLGHPLVLGDGNGRVMLSTALWFGFTFVYLPRSDVEGLPDMKYWFGVFPTMPI